jgi:hypothetical protein
MRLKTILSLFAMAALNLVATGLFAQIDWSPFNGNPVMNENFDPGSIEIARPSVIRKGSAYHLWYGNTRRINNRNLDYMGYATSPDGINWTLVDPAALAPSLDANRFDQLEASQGWVIADGDTFKMWYWGFNSNFGQTGISSIGYARSTDGRNWTRVNGPGTFGSVYDPIMDGGIGALVTPCVIKDGNTYRMWYGRNTGFQFRVAYATSANGINWTNVPGTGTNGAVLDWGPAGNFDEKTVAWPAVIKTAQGFMMWYDGVDDANTSRLGCAVSSDGINWTRLRGNAAKGACFEAAHFASVINQGNSYQMWYGVTSGDVVNYATSFTTGAEERREENFPATFVLEQNYPNPFNPSTTIRFGLPMNAQATLAVYNALGQKVRTLMARRLAAGQHQVAWDGRDDLGKQVASGVYFLQIRAATENTSAEFVQVKKMLLAQ